MAGIWRRWRRSEDGASALEFALISPVLVMMIIGSMQVAIAFHKGSSVQWASEQALRMAMVDADMSQVELQAAVEERLSGLGSGLDVQVAYVVDRSGTIPIGRMTVDYVYPVTIPLLKTFDARFQVSSSAPLLE